MGLFFVTNVAHSASMPLSLGKRVGFFGGDILEAFLFAGAGTDVAGGRALQWSARGMQNLSAQPTRHENENLGPLARNVGKPSS